MQDIFADIILDEAPTDKYPDLEEFLDYMTTTWVDDNANFPISLWNQFTNSDERTNNNNEAYNLRINKRTGPASHPNIYKFIELMQEEEFLLVQVKFARLSQRILKSKGRNKSDMARDLQIFKAKNK